MAYGYSSVYLTGYRRKGYLFTYLLTYLFIKAREQLLGNVLPRVYNGRSGIESGFCYAPHREPCTSRFSSLSLSFLTRKVVIVSVHHEIVVAHRVVSCSSMCFAPLIFPKSGDFTLKSRFLVSLEKSKGWQPLAGALWVGQGCSTGLQTSPRHIGHLHSFAPHLIGLHVRVFDAGVRVKANILGTL